MKSQIYGLKILVLLTLFSSDSLADNLPNQIVWNQDGAEMAYIPAGSFEMGDHLDNMADALPVHTVSLDGFYMDKTEVTVGQFKSFLEDSGYSWAGFTCEAGSINGIAMCGSNWGRGAKGAMSNNGSVVSTSHNSIGGWIGFWEF